MRYTFPKSQRLTSKKEIDQVFAEGKVLKQFPLIVRYLVNLDMEKECLKAVFSVPKRRFPKATARNKVRRKLKEAYRLNKYLLEQPLEDSNHKMALFFVYTGKENITYAILEQKIQVILKELAKKVSSSKQ